MKIPQTPWPCCAFIFSLILVTKLVHAQTSDAIPSVGTFYLQSAGSVSVPYPYDPYYGNEPIEVLNASNRVYLIQDSTDDFAALQSVHSLARRSMAMDDVGGDSGDGSDSFSYVVPTNGLWLELTNVSGGLAHLNLHNATNSVYEIFSKTALTLTNWNIELALWPTNGAVMPFTVPVLDRTDNLFIWARDWTGVTSGGNTVPEWWFWQNFGTIALSDTNLDSTGESTLLYDYENGLDPNVIQFSLGVANNYVNTSQPTLSANVSAGTPFYYAAVVDSTNLAGATWTAYTSSNLTANLGSLQGWHQVWVGLRGRPATATPSWQWKRLKLDTTPPVLVITSPTNSTVSVPVIQLTGYSPEALSGISYDLTNALGLVTNQQVLVTDQAYSTNTCEFTTNTFQAFDVAITNGLNTFTLHATDLAGNVTTTNVSFTLDYSGKTNPPSVQISWPQNGAQISGSNFTCRGWISDPSATVAATLDNGGTTNTFFGVVERDGHLWLDNLPLASGTNAVTLTVTDAAGNVSTTNLTVRQSPALIAITPPNPNDLWQPTVTVTGTISTNTWTVWGNGMPGTNNGDGTFTIPNVPVSPGGSATMDVTAYPPGQDPGGSGGGPGDPNANPANDNPAAPGAVRVELNQDKPARVFVASDVQQVDAYTDYKIVAVGYTDGIFDFSQEQQYWSHYDHTWGDGTGGSGSAKEMWQADDVGPGIPDDSETNWTSTQMTWSSNAPAGVGLVRNLDGSWLTNSISLPVIGYEHCAVSDPHTPPPAVFSPAGILGVRVAGDTVTNTYPDTYTLTAQTKLMLQTGGRALVGVKNLFVISGSATEILNKRAVPPYYGTSTRAIPPQNIQVGALGNLDTNGLLYVTLPDGDPDVTALVLNKDFYTFSIGAPSIN